MINELKNGAILVAYDRYYKIKDNQFYYSDCLCCWKPSQMTMNDFLKVDWKIYKEVKA